MLKDIKQDLPPVIVDHLAACNAHDPEAFMATFAEDALVNDAHREFLGHPAIRTWADKEIFGDSVTFGVQAAYDHYGDYTVRCITDGIFDKTKLPDPVILTHYFSLRGGKITQLIILLNKAIA